MTKGLENIREMQRVFEIIYTSAQKQGLVTKACGSFAIFMTIAELNNPSMSSEFSGHFFKQNYRPPRDLDIVSTFEQKAAIENLILSLGIKKDDTLETIPGIKRSLFGIDDIKIDVFYDAFDFNHLIDLTLSIEKPAGVKMKKVRSIDRPGKCITRTEQLLQKMQIVNSSSKDLIDAWWLLSASKVKAKSNGAIEAINTDVIQYYTSKNWGFFHTFKTNLDRLKGLIEEHNDTSSKDLQGGVLSKINLINRAIDEAPKSLTWKLRALAGTNLKWYQDVDDL